MHDLESLERMAVLPKTKGVPSKAVCFCKEIQSLCVGVRKKLRVFKWDGLGFQDPKEFAIADDVISLMWAHGAVVCAFTRDWVLLDPKTGEQRKRVFQTAAATVEEPVPRSVVVKEGIGLDEYFDEDEEGDLAGEMLLVQQAGIADCGGIFLDLAGRPTRAPGQMLKWESPPQSLAATREFPYVLSQLSRRIEVHSSITTNLAQTIPIANVVTITNCTVGDGGGGGASGVAGGAGGDSAAESDVPKLFAPEREGFVVAGLRDVYLLRMVPLMMQVAALMSRVPPDFVETLRLVEHCAGGVSEAKVRQIRSDYGYVLFSEGRFPQSLAQLDAAQEPLKRTLGLFPRLLPTGVSLSTSYPVNMPELRGEPFREALAALIPYLQKQRKRLGCDVERTDDVDSDDDEDECDEDDDDQGAAVATGAKEASKPGRLALSSKALVDTVLVTAYLERLASEADELLSVGTGAAVVREYFGSSVRDDAHMLDGVSAAASGAAAHVSSVDALALEHELETLLSGPNRCYVEECESQLRAHEKYDALVLLYRSVGEHRKAFELLTQRFKVAEHGRQRQTCLAALVDYAQQLGGEKEFLVYECARSLLAHGEESVVDAGFAVLAPPLDARGTRLDDDDVLAFLLHDRAPYDDVERSSDPNAPASKWDGNKLALRFLDYLVHDRRSVEKRFHNQLVFMYIDVLTALYAERRSKPSARERRKHQSLQAKIRAAAEARALANVARDGLAASGGDDSDDVGAAVSGEGAGHDEEAQMLLDRHRSSTVDSRIRVRPRAGTEAGEIGKYRRSLLRFLSTSTYYSAEDILSRLPDGELLEERAILLGRLAKHEAALRVYAQKLADDSMAEAYCDRAYETSPPDAKPGVYAALLRAYIFRDDGTPVPLVDEDELGMDSDGFDNRASLGELLGAAMRILARNVDRVSVKPVLGLLPDDAPVASVAPFLEVVLRTHAEELRAQQISAQMLKLQNLEARKKLLDIQATSFSVDERTRCIRCKRRIAKSLLARLHTGRVIHYSCLLPGEAPAPRPGAGEEHTDKPTEGHHAAENGGSGEEATPQPDGFKHEDAVPGPAGARRDGGSGSSDEGGGAGRSGAVFETVDSSDDDDVSGSETGFGDFY